MTLPAFASTDDLANRLPGGLRDADLTRAQAALDLVSTLIRVEGHLDWVSEDVLDFTKGNAALSEALKQDIVAGVCVAAALRNFENPESFDQETGASSPTNLYLSKAERRAIRQACGVTGLGTISLTRSVDDAPDVIDCVNADSGAPSTMPFTYEPLEAT